MILNKILDRYKFVFSQVWNICSKPDATLSYESLLNTFYGKKMLQHFILPLAEILFVATFVGTIFLSDFNVAVTLVKAIFGFLTFVVSYGLSLLLVRLLTQRFFVSDVNHRNIDFMVSSLMSIVFVVKFFGVLMPDLFFVTFFYLYTFYLVWVMSEGVIDISEDKRNKYMIFVSFIVVFLPAVVGKLLNVLIPNL